MLEGRQKLPRHGLYPFPSIERRFRQPSIGKNSRDLTSVNFAKHIRPNFLLDPHGSIGLPVVEEAVHPRRDIKRQILMYSILGEFSRDNTSGRHGSGGHKDVPAEMFSK